MERRYGLRPGQPRHSEGAVRRHKPDHWLLIIGGLLMAIGLVVVYSISPALSASQHTGQSYFIVKQLIDVALGVLTFSIASYFPLNVWPKSAKPLAIAALTGSLLVMVMPVDAVYQAHRWVRLGGFSFQVAELIKLAILVGLSSFLAQRARENRLADFNATLKPLVFLLAGIGLVVAKLQSDLGSAGVMIAMLIVMAYVAGIPLKKAAMIAGLVIILLVVAVSSSSYRRERLATFMHPEADCLTTGYQACQALISVGSGGVLGLGLGYSVQAYGYLPEASNDSIFAIMAEKFGFVGTFLIMVIYGALITRLKRIAERTSDISQRLLVVGVMAWLSVQMIINVGAMTGLLPLKGITLPLISQGGTSMIFLTAALGIVFQISRYTSYSVIQSNAEINETASSNGYFDGGRVRRARGPAVVARPRT
ncbi:MAG TPA: putative peptidoglycan glycosyltransferase FtsW [Candidatus Saccharimonadales bacterium]|nr:putative peptidoglycan glycosyltransferase FtsW [Candidatus Saccharimonadales bacterium]